jgi:hypothetical protein
MTIRTSARQLARKELRRSASFRAMNTTLAGRLVEELVEIYIADPDRRDMSVLALTYRSLIQQGPWGNTPEGFESYARTLDGVAV